MKEQPNFERLLGLLENIAKLHEQQMQSYTRLLESSEKRIDKTNEMVNNLSNVVLKVEGMLSKITDIYTSQIKKTVDSRRKIENTNILLVNELHRQSDENEKLIDVIAQRGIVNNVNLR